MSKTQMTHSNAHCINVSTVFDWIVHSSNIRMKIPILINKKKYMEIFILKMITKSLHYFGKLPHFPILRALYGSQMIQKIIVF